MSRARGFTFIEVLISTAVLAVLLLAGVSVARSATTVAQDSVQRSVAERRAKHAQDAIRRLLASAGRSTLEAVPAGGGNREPMQDGIAYDNLSFRNVVASGPAGSVYEPDAAEPPLSLTIQFRDATSTEGDLIWTDLRGAHAIGAGIQSLEFIREGSRVTARITTTSHAAGGQPSRMTGSLVLRNL